MDLFLVAAGVAIGISVAAPLGPVNLFVIHTALRRGLASAMIAGLGSVAADVIFAALAAFGARSLESVVAASALPLTLAGGGLLVVIGVRTARHHVTLAELEKAAPANARQLARKFVTTFGLTITNPGALLGFLAIFGTMSAVLRLSESPLRPLLAVCGVAIGGTLWWLFLGYLVGRVKTKLTRTTLDRINRWAGILIAAFGFALLMDALF